MKINLKNCEKCDEDQLVITMSRDEATLLKHELPDDVSQGGTYPAPVYDLFYERFCAALGTESTLRPGRG